MDLNKQPMNELLDARFSRVEVALETLIKSISTYNPSPSTANNLVAADAELNQGLQYRTSSPLSLPVSLLDNSHH